MFSNHEMMAASATLRLIEAQLSVAAESLHNADIWSGDDAARFVIDWNAQVRQPLLAAARKLDGIQLEELTVEANT